MTLEGAHIHAHQALACFEATDVVRRLVHTRPLIHGGKPVAEFLHHHVERGGVACGFDDGHTLLVDVRATCPVWYRPRFRGARNRMDANRRPAYSRRLSSPPSELVSGFAGKPQRATPARRHGGRCGTVALWLGCPHAPQQIRLASARRAVPHGGVGVPDPRLRAGKRDHVPEAPRSQSCSCSRPSCFSSKVFNFTACCVPIRWLKKVRNPCLYPQSICSSLCVAPCGGSAS